MARRVAVLAFPRMDELDFVGVVSVARKAAAAARDFSVEVVALGGPLLLGSQDIGFQAPPEPPSTGAYDAWIVPGGPGILELGVAGEVGERLKTHIEQGGRVYTVCSGAFLLARLGVLRGLQVAVHASKGQALAIQGGCTARAGLVRDRWLTSIGGHVGAYVKGAVIGYQVVRDLVPATLSAVIARTEMSAEPFLGGCS